MITKEIRFSYNWNGKIDCRCFTTIRLYNPEKYKKGAVHQVTLKTKGGWVKCPGKAEIIETKKIYGKDLNEFICRLDTGYSVEETKKVLSSMYKGKDIENTAFSYTLYSYTEKR